MKIIDKGHTHTHTHTHTKTENNKGVQKLYWKGES